jgi:uncharacterized protein (UPF0548 family)
LRGELQTVTLLLMIFLRKPSPKSLRRILESQALLAFTYPGVGTTETNAPPPVGYVVDHTRSLLGQGSTTFERARAGLEGWRQFQLGWLEAFPSDTPIRDGETVFILARVFGLWWTNAARIVYTIDEPGEPVARFGFAYGTLPGHVESGEERFLLEWDRDTDQVWFDILAFSRPRHFLTRIGRRQARVMQKRFGQQSSEAMQSIVKI